MLQTRTLVSWRLSHFLGSHDVTGVLWQRGDLISMLGDIPTTAGRDLGDSTSNLAYKSERGSSRGVPEGTK